MMEKVKLTVTYDTPRTMYLRELANGRCSRVTDVIGETTRSWVSGKWRLCKYSKTQYAVVSESDYEEQCWASAHYYRIGQMLQRASPSVVRKVAELVGYVGKE